MILYTYALCEWLTGKENCSTLQFVKANRNRLRIALVNCLKGKRRIVSGRVNFDLLRLRVLCQRETARLLLYSEKTWLFLSPTPVDRSKLPLQVIYHLFAAGQWPSEYIRSYWCTPYCTHSLYKRSWCLEGGRADTSRTNR